MKKKEITYSILKFTSMLFAVMSVSACNPFNEISLGFKSDAYQLGYEFGTEWRLNYLEDGTSVEEFFATSSAFAAVLGDDYDFDMKEFVSGICQEFPKTMKDIGMATDIRTPFDWELSVPVASIDTPEETADFRQGCLDAFWS